VTKPHWENQIRQLYANAPRQPKPPLTPGPIVIFGAGSKGVQAYHELTKRGFEVVAFIDTHKSESPIPGVDLCHPDNPRVSDLSARLLPVVIGIFNYTANLRIVEEQLLSRGFTEIYTILDIQHAMAALGSYWLSDTSLMVPTIDEAVWLMNRLQDDESKHFLFDNLSARCLRSLNALKSPPCGQQYYPQGIAIPRDDVSLIDGGAFDGDTIRSLVSAGFNFNRIVAFEPDLANFESLLTTCQSLPQRPKDLQLLPLALAEKSRTYRFLASSTSSSAVDPEGNSYVQSIAIDESFPSIDANYVKLDIEGFESSALSGMKCLLSRCQPCVAVCVYHTPTDLWELPRLLDSILPSHEFYLRSHAFCGFELVLYAVKSRMTS
jgi:FkbM family methyltransferase